MGDDIVGKGVARPLRIHPGPTKIARKDAVFRARNIVAIDDGICERAISSDSGY